jgi:hypothetical protein
VLWNPTSREKRARYGHLAFVAVGAALNLGCPLTLNFGQGRTLQRPEFPEAFVAEPARRLAIDISSRVDIALPCDWEENETRKCLIASPRSEKCGL